MTPESKLIQSLVLHGLLPGVTVRPIDGICTDSQDFILCHLLEACARKNLRVTIEYGDGGCTMMSTYQDNLFDSTTFHALYPSSDLYALLWCFHNICEKDGSIP